MHDPYLHTFIDESEVTLKQQLYRMVHPARRESLEPVLPANGQDEGTAIGYAAAVRPEPDGPFLLYYMCHGDGRLRLARSGDGRKWERRGAALTEPDQYAVDNMAVVPVGRGADPWFCGACRAGYVYCRGSKTEGGAPRGLHLVRSLDGEHLEVRKPGILPGVGDRSSLYFDPVDQIYGLISRPSGRMPGFRRGELHRVRTANLWRSRDLVDWENHGIVLAYDERDRHDVEIYGMQPFRHGNRLLAWVEVYYRGVERLDTQLAHSRDGLHWKRVEPRDPALAMGGEGAWDSHWAVPTNNPPFTAGDRMLVLYSGSGTKHGSKDRHRRGIGLASLRRDGWVSLEAGRQEGVVVTRPLPLEQPMRLELNANCYSGYITVEVMAAMDGQESTPLAGYSQDLSRMEQVDGVRLPVHWGEQTVVPAQPASRCYLRFAMQQASFFAYRWVPAG